MPTAPRCLVLTSHKTCHEITAYYPPNRHGKRFIIKHIRSHIINQSQISSGEFIEQVNKHCSWCLAHMTKKAAMSAYGEYPLYSPESNKRAIDLSVWNIAMPS